MAITPTKDDDVSRTPDARPPNADALADSKESVKGADGPTLSNYIENIKMSTSNLVLSATKVPDKDDQLLDESKTAKQFSPVWRQVSYLNK